MSPNNKSNESVVSVQKSTYLNIDIDSLIAPLGGLKQFINRNDRVLLKANLLNASNPERHIVTHPAVIGAVAKSVLKAGGIPYIGDSPSGPFTKRRLEKVYSKAGLKKLAEELGIELNYNIGYKKITIPDGKRLKKIVVCDFFLEADKTIAIPKIKTHALVILTLATKIMYGVIPGLTKVRYHSKFIRRKAFAEMLIDALSVTNPDLIIMDGIFGMQGDGPAGGELVELGVMLASENSFAIDLAVCRMLDIEPVGVPTLKEAKVRGLWPSEITYPLLSPENVKYNDFILPSTAGYLLTGLKKPNRIPVPTDKCTACEDCVEICPKGIIKIINNIAKIDYSKCIKCYCCHEACAYDAIELNTIEK
jgi:uncharacterized protein (DUF362 family)/NAD-dependent dihydropyrimidine dehydrogenase PreA subunit